MKSYKIYLTRLLKLKLKKANEKSQGVEGNIDESHLDELEAITRLLKLNTLVSKHSFRNKMFIASSFIVTLGIVSLLVFVKIPETQVEMNLMLDAVSFTVTDEQIFTETLLLDEITVSGFMDVQISERLMNLTKLNQPHLKDISVLYVSALQSNDLRTSISLSQIIVPGSSKISIERPNDSSVFRLSLYNKKRIDIDLRGALNLSFQYDERLPISFNVPQRITCYFKDKLNPIDLKPRKLPVRVIPQLEINKLSLHHTEEYIDFNSSIIKPVSAIQSGTIYFESLGGKKKELRHGELLNVQVKEGSLTMLTIHKNYIHINFQGIVKRLESGATATKRSLMPSYLEWLFENHTLGLLWGSAIYLFGLIVTFINWWELNL